MAQFLRPNSNITQTNFTGGFAEIDEVSASDADYAYSALNLVGTLEVGLTNPSPAPVATRPATVRFRIAKIDGSGDVTSQGPNPPVTCYVYEGVTLRATAATVNATGTWTSYSFSPDLSAVTNFDNLQLRFVTDAVAPGVGISWAEAEVDQAQTFNDTITESAAPGDSLTAAVTFSATLTESSEGGDVYVTASNANIHAFTRLPFGEIWFAVPTGTGTTHTCFTFCVDESQRAQTPVWFKAEMNASAIIDDPQLGADGTFSCLRIGEGSSADLISFDRRADGTIEPSWHLTSSAFYVDEAERRVLIKRYYRDFENQDNDVTLQLLTYDFPAGANIASPSLTVGAADPHKDFRVSGRLMKMKFSGTGRARLGKPAFDITEMGER